MSQFVLQHLYSTGNTSESLDQPSDIVYLGNHTYIISDTNNHCLKLLELTMVRLATYAGKCGVHTMTETDVKEEDTLHYPKGLSYSREREMLYVVVVFYIFFLFFFKQKTAYEITRWLEFRRVLFRSPIIKFLGFCNFCQVRAKGKLLFFTKHFWSLILYEIVTQTHIGVVIDMVKFQILQGLVSIRNSSGG